MQAFLLCSVLITAVPVRESLMPQYPAPPAPPQNTLQGSWQLRKAVVLGKEMPLDQVRDKVILFENGRTLLMQAGQPQAEDSTYTVDLTTKPPTIDMVPRTGTDRQSALVGIFKIEGDTLTLCLTVGPRNRRPTEFASGVNDQTILFELQRLKK